MHLFFCKSEINKNKSVQTGPISFAITSFARRRVELTICIGCKIASFAYDAILHPVLASYANG